MSSALGRCPPGLAANADRSAGGRSPRPGRTHHCQVASIFLSEDGISPKYAPAYSIPKTSTPAPFKCSGTAAVEKQHHLGVFSHPQRRLLCTSSRQKRQSTRRAEPRRGPHSDRGAPCAGRLSPTAACAVLSPCSTEGASAGSGPSRRPETALTSTSGGTWPGSNSQPEDAQRPGGGGVPWGVPRCAVPERESNLPAPVHPLPGSRLWPPGALASRITP